MTATPGGGAGRPRILFVTSNGTGLGHLTRSMAIARRLGNEVQPLVFTLSAAAPVVAAAGFPVDYHPGYATPGAGSSWQWNLRLRDRLELLLDEARPDVLVFDGVHPYRALTHLISDRTEPVTVWCRRPMWRAGAGGPAMRRSGAFDLVLEPGELAEPLDSGRTVARRDEALRTHPIVYLDPDELLPRAEAERELGLEPGGTNVLVQLGQGGAVDVAVGRCLSHLAGRQGVRVAALESSLSPALAVPDEVVHVRGTFPISRLYRAFDLAVSASGYNAYHELLRFAVPTLFVPMPRELDDQAARARFAAEEGTGLAVAGPEASELEERLEEMLDPSRRAALTERAGEVWPHSPRRDGSPGNGAAEAAAVIAELAAGRLPAGAPAAARLGGRARGWRRQVFYSAHAVGPALPLALALSWRELRRDPRRRPPRAAIVALGLPPGELEGELRSALEGIDEDPAQVLVVTDSLDLATLRRLGVAIERVPAAEELGAYEEADRERLVRRRLAAALRRRPRLRRADAIGPASHGDLLDALVAPPRARARLLEG